DVVDGFGVVRGLSTARIRYAPTQVGSLTVNGGFGGNTFFVQTTVSGITPTLNAGDNADPIQVGGFTDTMDTIGGTPVINGQGGNGNIRELRDINSFKSRNATLHVVNGIGTIAGFGPGTIKYDALKLGELTVKSSNVSNVFTVANTSTNAITTVETGIES